MYLKKRHNIFSGAFCLIKERNDNVRNCKEFIKIVITQ